MLGYTLRRQHKEPTGVAIAQHLAHGGQSDSCLARTDRREDHRAVMLVQEVSRNGLIRT
jgi:hypothetical protein